MKRFGVREFHLEDLNPGILKRRISEICDLILEKGLDVVWKIGSGTKIEHLDEATIRKMGKAGCRYISISPESGSRKVLEKMGKFFDHDHAKKMVRVMHECGIISQACFVLGFPGEEEAQREETRRYILELARSGLDEIALFIMTPSPGSQIYDIYGGPKSLSSMTFSPKWRRDFPKIVRFRRSLYRSFLIEKAIHFPLDLLRQPFDMVSGHYRTKMEMAPVRLLRTSLMALRP